MNELFPQEPEQLTPIADWKRRFFESHEIWVANDEELETMPWRASTRYVSARSQTEIGAIESLAP